MITIDDVRKVEVKIGTVKSAERIPETDKLLRLMVDFGLKQPTTMGLVDQPAAGVGEERDMRQIVSGIAAYIPDPTELVGRQFSFITNLEPRMVKGFESNGMLFAVGSNESFAFLTPSTSVPPGTSAH